MAIPTLVQSVGGASSATSLTLTLGANTTPGNCLIVCTGSLSSNSTVSNVKVGTLADNFAKVISEVESTEAECEQWADPGLTVSSTSVVVTFSASAEHAAWVMEWANLVSGSVVDKTHIGNGAAVTSWSSGATGTLSQANELIVGAVASLMPTGTTTGPGSPWTELTQEGTSTAKLLVGYQVVSATTSITYNGTATDTYYAATVASYLGVNSTVPVGKLVSANQSVMRAAVW